LANAKSTVDARTARDSMIFILMCYVIKLIL
jgi:hypothetical protein